MNDVEFQFFSIIRIPDHVSDYNGFDVTIFNKGDLLKSGQNRLNNSIKYTKINVPLSKIDEVIFDFLDNNSEDIVNFMNLLDEKGEAFSRIYILSDFDRQICSVNFQSKTLNHLSSLGLSLDIVLREPEVSGV